MSQVITNAFETYWQGCLTDQVPVVLDEVVLADIPNLDITAPIDPNTGLPPQAQIVHRHPVDQRGRINNNAVAYSIVMDTSVGNFSFNAMYLINKASGMVGMIVYKGRETKTKTDQATGTTGNSLVKSMLMEYDQAANATVTTVEAGTWQIDYSARLLGMDEQLRLQAIACFGSSAFFGNGFKLINKAGSYKVQPGVAMVGGLRIQLDAEQAVTVGAKPVGVWVDVHHAGTILSRWDNHFEFKTSTTDLSDYTDSNGYRHYVAKLGVVEANETVTEKRQISESQDLLGALRAHAQGRDHPDASETAKGFTRYATQSQTDLGASDDVAVTPKKMRYGFTVKMGSPGYIVFPTWMSSLIIQWGRKNIVTVITSPIDITFPIAFTEECYGVVSTGGVDALDMDVNPAHRTLTQQVTLGRPTLTGVDAQGFVYGDKQEGRIFYWLALGK